ncbi:MAG: riboflavin synthase [Acidobacteria bacterium]|nr:MAG: riboflavin synthase [Acidobacteriota bacterium]
MFTGLIEEKGQIAVSRPRDGGIDLVVACDVVSDGLAVGDSVAVNGCCLTVVRLDEAGFEAQLVEETVMRTNLGALAVGDPVNLERSLRADGRFGGHIVQGHVDGPALLESVSLTPSGGRVHRYGASQAEIRYIVEKGSVAVDGVSLTVAAVGDAWFEVALIPHTLDATNLAWTEPGHAANLELDLVAKYVESLLPSLAGNDGEGGSGEGQRSERVSFN